MTPTAIYLAEENCLQELPRMEKPEPPLKPIYRRQFEPYYEELKEYERKRDKYKAHLATLRKIPCDPSCKGLWKDGQKVVENVDYEVQSMCGFYKTDCGKRKHCEDCRLVAFPLVPVSEDELHYEYAGKLAYSLGITINGTDWEEKALPELKKVFSLTKR